MRPDLYNQMYHQEEYYWWHKAKRNLVKQFLPAKNNLHILDIGCGTGKLLEELQLFGQIYGIDASPQAIAFCRRRGLTHVYQQQLPWIQLKSQFDLITCLDVLEHVPDEFAAVKTIKSLLKKNGRLILTVPTYPWLFSYWDKILGHQRRYRRQDLFQLITQSGLTVVKLSFIYSFLLPFVVPFRLIRQQFFHSRTPQSDFIEIPFSLHHALFNLAKLEQRLLKYVSLPFGLSLVCIAEKK